MKASDVQRKVFLDGLTGLKPEFPFEWQYLEKNTRKGIDKNAEAYIFGGAGNGETMRNNRSSLDEARIIPRMLSGIQEVQLETEILGTRLSHPIVASPVGVLEMAHPQADLALAEACRETDTLMIISSQASKPMEKIAAVLSDTPRWFQLYWNKHEEIAKSFVKRAEDCGCSAIVLTVDTPMPGWRTADLATGYLPFLEGKGIAQYTSDPVFLELAEKTAVERQPGQRVSLGLILALLRMHKGIPGGYFKNLKEKRALKWIRTFSESFPHPFLNWSHVETLRSWTSLPVVVKGIQDPADAQNAFDSGAQAVFVSNHGGRQIDGAIGSFSALKEVRTGIISAENLLFDSGIRSGADVFKALNAGAAAVGVGRPYVCGIALGGVKGAVHVFQSLRAELEATMTLAGVATVRELQKGNFCTY